MRNGVPFRESHHIVGELVRLGEERGEPLSELPLDVFQSLHAAFKEDVLHLFSFEASVEARGARGGTARQAVEEQMEFARQALAE